MAYETAKAELRFDDASVHATQLRQMAERDSGRYSLFYLESAEPEIQMRFDMGNYAGLDTMILELIQISRIIANDSSSLAFLYPAYLGFYYYTQNDFLSAAEISMQQADNWQRLHGKNNSTYGEFTHNIGASLNAAGHTDRAYPYLKEAIENAEALHTDSITLGERIITMGDYYTEMGLYNDALNYYQRAITLLGPHIEEDPLIYNIALSDVSMTLAQLGQYRESIDAGLECVENIRKMNGTDSEAYALANSGLIMSYSDLGQMDKGLRVCTDSKLIIDSIYGKSHPRYWMLSIDEAEIFRRKEDYQTALDKFLSLKALVDSSGGTDWNQYNIILSSIGMTYYDIKNFNLALDYINASIALAEKQNRAENPDYARDLLNKAQILTSSGMHTEALKTLQKSMEIIERQLGKNHKTYINALASLSKIHYSIGRHDLVVQDLQELSQLLAFRVHEYFSFLSEKERQLFLDDIQFYYALMNNLAARISNQHAEIIAQMYNNSLALKGLLARRSSQLREVIARSNDAMLISQYDEWIALKSFLSKQSALPFESRISYMDSLTTRAEQLEKFLLENSNEFYQTSLQDDISMSDILGQLKPGEAAVEFITYNNASFIPDEEKDYAALVLLAGDKNAHFIPLSAEGEIDKLIHFDAERKADYVDRIYQINDRGFVVNEQPVASAYELFWKPLESVLKGVKRVYFSPSGLLYRINLNAIAVTDSTILSDYFDLVQMESTRNILAKKITPEKSQREACLFGGITYSLNPTEMPNPNSAPSIGSVHARSTSFSVPDEVRGQYENWQYLPGTQKEVNSIASILAKKNIKTLTYTGAQGTEEAFAACSGESPDILHISTHGFFFNEPDQKTNTTGLVNEYHRSADPMIRSGILFAGANASWQNSESRIEGREDGILTARDISQMNLEGTELVVLSACETGLGDIVGNEGVYGLRRAFEIAGAEHLIMSLWQVPDKQTSELMILFYSNWILEGMNIHDAFNAAQRVMRMKYDNPYFWAGFVLCE